MSSNAKHRLVEADKKSGRGLKSEKSETNKERLYE
jgi:hypothetical protein